MTATSFRSSVEDWLQQNGLKKYEPLFRENEIDLDLLPELDGQDLKELGIPLGDRKRLLRAIAKLKSSDLHALPRAGEESRETAQVGRAERRQITIMFCDLVSATKLSNELDPEEFADVLRAYRRCCTDAIVRWGGSVAQHLGDGALAYFGWPQTHEDVAERAVRAGLELVAAVGKIRAGATMLSARIGIATGLVMVGELIEGFAKEEGVVGAIPNLAARLQAVAEPGTVVVAPATYQLVSRRFEFTDLGAHQLKGFSEATQVWRADRALATTPFEARVASGLTPMVDRKRELRFLTERWEWAQRGSGQAVLVSGEAGVGKSRIVRALADGLAGVPHVALHWQCSSYYTGSALHPFVERFNRFASIGDDDPAETKLQKVETILARKGLDVGESAPVLTALLSFPLSDRHPRLDLSLQRQRQKTIEVVASLTLGMAGDAALLLIVEDVHWADSTTLAVLIALIGRIEQERVMVLVTARSDFQPDWEPLRVAKLDMKRFTRAPARVMVRRMMGDKALPRTVVDSILSTTDGVPLFVEELTKTVVESGQLREAEDGYELRGSVIDLSIPATLRDSLAARLDRLAPDSKEIAQVAATIGRTCASDLLGHVAQRPPTELRGALAQLCEAGILEQRGSALSRRYVFKHALIQEAAYRSQLNARRRELHGRVARALETHFPKEAESLPETLAHHFAEAGLNEVAGGYLLKASHKALRLTAISEAITHLSKGLALVGPLPSSESRDLLALRLHALLGTALMLGKGWAAPEAEAAYAAANALSHTAKDPDEAIWILWGIWVYHHVRGNMHQAIEVKQSIRAAAEQHTHAVPRLIADMTAMQASFYAGRFEETVGYCQALARAFSPPHHRALASLYTVDLELVGLVHHSITAWILGKPDEAAALAWTAEQLARSLDHPYSLAWTLAWGSTPYLLRREWEPLASRLEEAIGIANRQGFSYITAMGAIMRGWVVGKRGASSEGIAQMNDGLAAFRATGAGIVVPHFRTLLAEVLGDAGRLSEASGVLQQAQEQIERWGERWQLAEVHRVRGDVLAAGDDADLAEQSYAQSLALATSQSATGWRLRTRESLDRFLDRRGKQERVRKAAEPRGAQRTEANE